MSIDGAQVAPPPDAVDSMAPLHPLRVPKASDVLAEELAGRISRGELREGDVLPPEREMVLQTGLSRTSVREALRVLEIRGFVEIRSGRSGGAFVRRPSGHDIASTVRLVVRGTQVSLAALLQTRATIEPACAGLASVRHTEADLLAMDATNLVMAEAQDVNRFLRSNVDWHMAVARAAGNELLSGLMEALAELIYDSTGYAGSVDGHVRAETCRAHQAITAAIRAGDKELAQRRMTAHVEAYVNVVADEIPVGEGVVGGLDWTGHAHQVDPLTNR